MYGLALVVFILLSLLAKYPAFLFASKYAAATGRSLLSSYRRQGKGALWFFTLSTLFSMFIATAANLLITAGLAQATMGLDLGIFYVAVFYSVAGMALLIFGQYHWLDIVIKVLVILLTVATVTATALALPNIDWSVSGALLPSSFDVATILFIAALVGWMPTPLDVSVWQSQWAVAKARDTGKLPSQKEAGVDFNIGYVTTMILALCFVALGASVMHGTGQSFESNPTLFAAQVIGLYQETLGNWSGHVVGIAALAVMFSTYLTILDGFPRVLANLVLIAKGKEEAADEDEETDRQRHYYYRVCMVIMVIGALIIMNFFLGSLSQLVDFAATVSFLGAPVFAYLNHRAIHGTEVPVECRPGTGLRYWSYCGIAALVVFSLLYIYLAFFN